ncbi:earthbound 2 [Haematobia irritans]|uniref:earthbound 2 n=1 Tax=Haematobia irritans TaxID=7368 RepID=UPI003F4FB028
MKESSNMRIPSETTVKSRRSSGANSNGSTNAVASVTNEVTTRKPKKRNERNILTFYEKIAVIRYYDETNISRNSLAKMFHCCATQIRRILERKQELMQQLATLSEADASIIIEEMTRKRRKFEMSAISFILHQWVERCRQMRLRKSITNETLKETAVKMAAILNLPAFRPSYRWLNRFRGKYKYNDEDLGAGTGVGTVAGELSVEDIIIEYKDSLPSFMQKEISAITSSANDALLVPATENDLLKPRIEIPIIVNDKDINSMDEYEISEDDDDDEDFMNDSKDRHSDEDVIEVKTSNPISQGASQKSPAIANTESQASLTKPNEATNQEYPMMTAGSAALLHSIFPHLAVIHQFALLNSDVKALELISQLGVHMQTQAAEGAYKQLSLATPTTINGLDCDDIEVSGDIIYPDIDDIVLIE